MTNDPDTPKTRAQTTYNAAADFYESAALWERYGRRTVERLNLTAGLSVLDVGCGTGASAIPAAQKVAPHGTVIGVDLAENLLNIGRAKAAKLGLQNVDFRVGDMENLGFSDGHFDTVISVFSIFFVPDMERQVRELRRMARQDGQLAITTWGPNFCEPMNTRWWEAVRHLRPDLHTSFRPWERITTPKAVRQLLLDGGITEIGSVVPESGSQALRTPDDWWDIVLGSGYRWTVEKLGPELAAQVREDNLKWAQENAITNVETNVIYAVITKA